MSLCISLRRIIHFLFMQEVDEASKAIAEICDLLYADIKMVQSLCDKRDSKSLKKYTTISNHNCLSQSCQKCIPNYLANWLNYKASAMSNLKQN